MPAKFREALGEKFFITKGLDDCLFVYTEEKWAEFEEKLKNIPLTTKDARKFTRFFFAGATECEFDKQGRVLIPANLRNHAHLEKEVVLAGVLSRIEIWSLEKWKDQETYEDMDEVAEHMADLGLGI